MRSEASVDGKRTRKLLLKLHKALNKKLDMLVKHVPKKKKTGCRKSESAKSDEESHQLLVDELDSKEDELSSLKSEDIESTQAKKVAEASDGKETFLTSIDDW